jgi:hypothetical protein
MSSSDPSPPFGDDTDEAISARLDGRLAAFAAERGVTEAEADAALEAWPGTPARAAALQRGRDAASTPVEPLDDLTRRRLVTGALGATGTPEPAARPPRRSVGSWWSLAAAAVVAVLVLVAVGAMVLNGDDDRAGNQASSSADDGASRVEAAAEGDLGELGDVSDPAVLRALLGGEGADARRESSSTTAPPAAAGGATADSGEDAAGLAPNRNFQASKEACAAQLAGSRPVRFVGTGLYRGRPVVVVGLSREGRTIAFVVPADSCTTVLTSVSR